MRIVEAVGQGYSFWSDPTCDKKTYRLRVLELDEILTLIGPARFDDEFHKYASRVVLDENGVVGTIASCAYRDVSV